MQVYVRHDLKYYMQIIATQRNAITVIQGLCELSSEIALKKPLDAITLDLRANTAALSISQKIGVNTGLKRWLILNRIKRISPSPNDMQIETTLIALDG